MNRLILIGNGFDLAHGLKTSYEDFYTWYKRFWVNRLHDIHNHVVQDPLCSIAMDRQEAWSIYIDKLIRKYPDFTLEEIFDYLIEDVDDFAIDTSQFFKRIRKGIDVKRWVDIENEYYKLLIEYAFPVMVNPFEKGDVVQLNKQLQYLQDLLVQYLQEVEQRQEVSEIKSIKDAIYAPFEEKDIAITEKWHLQEHVDHWGNSSYDIVLRKIIELYAIDADDYISELNAWRIIHNHNVNSVYIASCPKAFLLPQNIMFLNFNYTDTINQYIKTPDSIVDNHIHGEIGHPESIIFGYGDELDSDYSRLQNLNNNEYLQNVKSIRYLETPNYRDTLSFIESAPFQVLIMGHSCGNSDRTLLNTIFEHKNCVSIKPYYYKKDDGTDNYRELVQNISRNFTDMKLMRDRVVNKTQCEPLVKH